MIILTIETSGNICGVSLSNDDKLIDKIELNKGLTHSEVLMPLIQKLLTNNKISFKSIDAFICDIGPGSFTGIRIGVATTLAFIDASSKSIFTGICSLEALAYNCTSNGYICSVLNCKNDNCYFALYEHENEKYKELISPKASSINEMLEYLSNYNASITFVGDGAVEYKKQIESIIPKALFLENSLNTINTENVALAGLNRLNNKNTLPMLPMYLKKPQAELLLKNSSKPS